MEHLVKIPKRAQLPSKGTKAHSKASPRQSSGLVGQIDVCEARDSSLLHLHAIFAVYLCTTVVVARALLMTTIKVARSYMLFPGPNIVSVGHKTGAKAMRGGRSLARGLERGGHLFCAI